jgi:GNAT superfamily N-acetyltransferase
MSIPFSKLQFKKLDESDDLSLFECSDPELDEYLKEDAMNDQRSKISVTRLAMWNGRPVGYFTLVNAVIKDTDVKAEDAEKEYEYPHYPAIKIARLATHRDYEGNGVGRAMLLRTMAISSQLSLHVGCRFIIVDAKNSSVGFYEKFGFVVAKTREKTTSMYRNVPV